MFDKKEWKCDNGKTYLVPGDACPVCKHCTAIFWDYTNGPYMFFCDIPDTKPWEACIGGCPKYEEERWYSDDEVRTCANCKHYKHFGKEFPCIDCMMDCKDRFEEREVKE